jgi:DegV family protein with EDD domain
MPFYINGECCYEETTLSRQKFFKELESGADVSTSQPSPEEVMQIWNQGLQEYEEILYMPISSGLSGSCETARVIAQEEEYKGRVYVVDNGRVSTPAHRSVLDMLELIKEGYSAVQIQQIMEKARDKMVIYVAVKSLAYLKKGGRIKPTVAAIGTILNIKPILKFDVGTLDSYKNCRGFAKAKKTMIEAIQHDLQTTFKTEYEKGAVHLLAASSASQEETQQWVKEVQEAFPNMDVLCDDLSLGVSCHIGPGGLGIGLSCVPEKF